MITPERIQQWVDTFNRETPHRFTVVRLTTAGCQFLLAPGVFVEENELTLAWEGSTQSEAAKRLGETFDVMEHTHGPEYAGASWRASRLIPVGTTGNRYEDFPT